MNRTEQIIFGTLGLIFAAFACIAAWLIFYVPTPAPSSSNPPLSTSENSPAPTIADPPTQPPPLTIMDNIYNSLRLEDLVAEKAIYTSGEKIVFSSKLTNLSNQTLIIPEDDRSSRTDYLVGNIYRWIERLGTDNVIPSIHESSPRDGSRYLIGSYGIDVGLGRFLGKRVIEPAESIPLNDQLDTSVYFFPLGMYRLYVCYTRLDGSVIQTLNVDFEIR
jgi:hypothetical protein